MDDFIILSESVDELKDVLGKIGKFVNEELKLELNPKTTIIAAKNGVDFVGYRHFPTFKIMRKGATRRLKDQIKAFENGESDITHFDRSIQSRLGHMKHADTYHLREDIKNQIIEIKTKKEYEELIA